MEQILELRQSYECAQADLDKVEGFAQMLIQRVSLTRDVIKTRRLMVENQIDRYKSKATGPDKYSVLVPSVCGNIKDLITNCSMIKEENFISFTKVTIGAPKMSICPPDTLMLNDSADSDGISFPAPPLVQRVTSAPKPSTVRVGIGRGQGIRASALTSSTCEALAGFQRYSWPGATPNFSAHTSASIEIDNSSPPVDCAAAGTEGGMVQTEESTHYGEDAPEDDSAPPFQDTVYVSDEDTLRLSPERKLPVSCPAQATESNQDPILVPDDSHSPVIIAPKPLDTDNHGDQAGVSTSPAPPPDDDDFSAEPILDIGPDPQLEQELFPDLMETEPETSSTAYLGSNGHATHTPAPQRGVLTCEPPTPSYSGWYPQSEPDETVSQCKYDVFQEPDGATYIFHSPSRAAVPVTSHYGHTAIPSTSRADGLHTASTSRADGLHTAIPRTSQCGGLQDEDAVTLGIEDVDQEYVPCPWYEKVSEDAHVQRQGRSRGRQRDKELCTSPYQRRGRGRGRGRGHGARPGHHGEPGKVEAPGHGHHDPGNDCRPGNGRHDPGNDCRPGNGRHDPGNDCRPGNGRHDPGNDCRPGRMQEPVQQGPRGADRQVMVTGLDPADAYTETCLGQLFSQFGHLVFVKVMRHGKSAILTYSSEEEARKVITMEKLEFGFRQIHVRRVHPQGAFISGNHQLLVTQIPGDMTHSRLRDIIETVGVVRGVNLNPDGFALVQMASLRDMETVLNAAPIYTAEGHPLSIDVLK